MRTLTRDMKPVFLCKKIPNSEPTMFEEPIKYMLNTVATTTETDLVAFGEAYKEYRRAKVTISQIVNFNEGDRVYINVAPPVIHDPLCNGCDFQIKSVSDSVSQGSILFKRLQIGKT